MTVVGWPGLCEIGPPQRPTCVSVDIDHSSRRKMRRFPYRNEARYIPLAAFKKHTDVCGHGKAIGQERFERWRRWEGNQVLPIAKPEIVDRRVVVMRRF